MVTLFSVLTFSSSLSLSLYLLLHSFPSFPLSVFRYKDGWRPEIFWTKILGCWKQRLVALVWNVRGFLRLFYLELVRPNHFDEVIQLLRNVVTIRHDVDSVLRWGGETRGTLICCATTNHTHVCCPSTHCKVLWDRYRLPEAWQRY
jgi:hypothetical protein